MINYILRYILEDIEHAVSSSGVEFYKGSKLCVSLTKVYKKLPCQEILGMKNIAFLGFIVFW